MLAWAMVRPARRAWIEGLAAAATLFALVPLVDALMVSRNLFTGLAAGDWLFVGFDAVMVLLAASFACAARIESRVTLPTSRSEERTSELQSLMRIPYAVVCLKKNKQHQRDGTSSRGNDY